MQMRLLNWLHADEGATAIEYAIMATGIALAIISVVSGIGTKLGTYFTQVSVALK